MESSFARERIGPDFWTLFCSRSRDIELCARIVIEFLDPYSIYSWDEAGGKGHAIRHGVTDPLESGSEANRPRRLITSVE